MKVGDKVVCVNGYASQGLILKQGEIFEVKAISSCQCGPLLDVGVKHPINTVCYTCGMRNNGVFHFASRFRPVEYPYGTEVCEAIERGFKEITLEPWPY
jgi:hypothetical protein